MAHSRKDVSDTLAGALLSACAPAVPVPGRLVMEHVLLVSVLHRTVGVEVGPRRCPAWGAAPSILPGHGQRLALATSRLCSPPSTSLLLLLSGTGRHLGVSHSDTDLFQTLRVQWLAHAHQSPHWAGDGVYVRNHQNMRHRWPPVRCVTGLACHTPAVTWPPRPLRSWLSKRHRPCVSEPRPRKRCRRFVTAASCVKDGARRTPGRGPGTGEGPGSPARGQQDPSAPCAARSGSRSPEALASALRATRSSQPQSWARGASPGPTPPRLAAVPGLP